ncbi:hypothetical protein Tco_1304536 [Tanacetum coccineum]
MTKVIKEEFEKLESLKIGDGSFACDTSLKIFHKEFNWVSRMDNDLFTYVVEFAGLANIPCDLNEDDDSKQQMTHESGKDLEYDPSDARGDDEVELTDEESLDFDDEDEVAKIFRIDTNVFDFETPIMKMCHGYMKDHRWIMEHGKNPLQLEIIVSLLIIKMDVRNGQLVAGKMMDIVGEEDKFENTNHDNNECEYEMEHEDEERCELFDDQKRSVCDIRRFKMIKYSFRDDEEYVAIK